MNLSLIKMTLNAFGVKILAIDFDCANKLINVQLLINSETHEKAIPFSDVENLFNTTTDAAGSTSLDDQSVFNTI